MAAPQCSDTAIPRATSDRIVGPIVASLAVVAMWEVVRGLRWATAAPALWLLAAPWVLGYETVATVNGISAGTLLMALGFVRGAIRQRFGGDWASLAKHGR